MGKDIKITPSAPAPNTVELALRMIAEMMLGDFFFDPENERKYKQDLLANRPTGTEGLVLHTETLELTGATCVLRIEALKRLTRFRVAVSHPAFDAKVEGIWSFAREELSQVTYSRTGDERVIEDALEAIIDEFASEDGDDEELLEFLNANEVDDDDEAPLIGDDPTEPPAATGLERSRLKATAKRIARRPDVDMAVEDRLWLEQTPQLLPVITESLVAAAGAAKRDDGLVLAYQTMLTAQLEFVRYRQDRGWAWADAMLQAYQRRLIEIGKVDSMPRRDWFQMCAALQEARVPVADAVQTELAEAGFTPEASDTPPEEMMAMVRHYLGELARMVSSPFDVADALRGSGAMLPAMLRSFMATELALSPHGVLRDAVPLLLLDDDASVRTAAAGALEQTAHPDTLSADSLRRAIAMRNWIPPAGRPALDAAIRKARLAGVEIGAWPTPASDLEFYASTVDGSGAQSILTINRSGKKGIFGGLLLRHGAGVVDGWLDRDLPRSKIGKLLREAQMATPLARVDRPFVDLMVQHAIAASVEHDGVPPPSLLEIGETVGGSEWQDRRIDVKTEADRLFAGLEPADRTPEGIAAGFERGMGWMASDDVFGSWFEDGPQVQKTLASSARTDRKGMVKLVMSEILPRRRDDWTERFLILALLSRASAEARQRARARDLVLVAHALAGDGPLEAIPAMGLIAQQTVQAMLLGGW